MLKQVTPDINIVEVGAVNRLKSIYKVDFINYITKDHKEIKKLKWEVMMLVKKANEHALAHEIRSRKSIKDMTEEEAYAIRQDFFERYIKDITDEKADRLIELLDLMIINRGGKGIGDVSIS